VWLLIKYKTFLRQ